MPGPTERNHSRRDFLITTGAALAAGTMARVGSAAMLQAAEPKKLGWACVGVGSLTMNQILPALIKTKMSKPVALVSGHPDKAKAQAEKFGIDPKNIYSYENYDSIKDNPAVDVIYNVLPNGMHCEYTVRGFQAGKHVFCEKPMANTAAESQQMIDAGKKADKKLAVAYRMHYEPVTLAAIEAIKRGDIGPLQIIEAAQGFRMGGPGVWRLDKKLAGGGCMMDIGIYALQAARYLSGEEPTEVTGMIRQDTTDERFKEVEQICNFMLKFPSGVTASCTSSYATGLGRFVAHGERGQIILEPSSPYHGTKAVLQRGGRGGPGTQPTIAGPDIDQFAAEMDAFSDHILNNAPNKIPGEEGLRDMIIIDAIYESARSGKTIKLV